MGNDGFGFCMETVPVVCAGKEKMYGGKDHFIDDSREDKFINVPS